jgi:hypothetical protein
VAHIRGKSKINYTVQFVCNYIPGGGGWNGQFKPFCVTLSNKVVSFVDDCNDKKSEFKT